MTDAAHEFTQIRKAMGLKQTEMAALLGVTQATISRWERNIDGPDTRTMIAARSLLAMRAAA
jgi:transcriptional regulator with XRE-family HTH domain